MEDFEINSEINSREICGNFPKNIQMGRGRGERGFGREGEKEGKGREHRDRTRVQTPAKMFLHLKLLCWLFMGPTLGFET